MSKPSAGVAHSMQAGQAIAHLAGHSRVDRNNRASDVVGAMGHDALRSGHGGQETQR